MLEQRSYGEDGVCGAGSPASACGQRPLSTAVPSSARSSQTPAVSEQPCWLAHSCSRRLHQQNKRQISHFAHYNSQRVLKSTAMVEIKVNARRENHIFKLVNVDESTSKAR